MALPPVLRPHTPLVADLSPPEPPILALLVADLSLLKPLLLAPFVADLSPLEPLLPTPLVADLSPPEPRPPEQLPGALDPLLQLLKTTTTLNLRYCYLLGHEWPTYPWKTLLE